MTKRLLVNPGWLLTGNIPLMLKSGKLLSAPQPAEVPTDVAPCKPELSRQNLRREGRTEVYEAANKKFAGLTRKQRRLIARATHKNSWDARDKNAVAKVINQSRGPR